MSGNQYGYYYGSSQQNFPTDSPTHTWSEWSLEQQQYDNNVRNTAQHHNSGLNHTNHSTTYPVANRSQTYYNSTRQFPQRRFNSPSQQYSGGQQQWQRNNNYNKRPRLQDSPGDNGEPKNKTTKKKKKPLSQNIPSKKDWTLAEADMALSVEKEYNKRYKNHSLIIKFPDQELNRDIVSKFHPSIENVHFQQPSTPRFCFVTLQESADADAVITALNEIKFGDGHLTAEFKKDREEDQNIGPEDIDPCTLYVGNLAQEITKDDMVKTYPLGRRIDIGYAKKMKYTRYAFVSFKNVSDSIEAFKKTHSTQMHSKSLIVRFRRLHGTVGMPGESKPQTPAKKTDTIAGKEQTNDERIGPSNSTNNDKDHDINMANETQSPRETQLPQETQSSQSELGRPTVQVKQEVDSSGDESSQHKLIPEDYESPFMEGSLDVVFEQHKPIIKREIKAEVEDNNDCGFASLSNSEVNTQKNSCSTLVDGASEAQANGSRVASTTEPQSATISIPAESIPTIKSEHNAEDDSSDDDDAGGGLGDVNFSSLLNQLDQHSSQIESLRKWAP